MNRSLVAALFAALLAASLSPAFAQDAPRTPSPDATRQEMVRQALQGPGALAPPTSSLTDTVIESQLRAGERPDTARRIAVFKKNLYDALQAQGFTKAEALAITASATLPGAVPAGR